LNASTVIFFTESGIMSEEVKVCTVHRGQHWKVNWVDVFMLYSSENGLDPSAWILIAVCTTMLRDPLKGDWHSE
jgi:hypothetical protein